MDLTYTHYPNLITKTSTLGEIKKKKEEILVMDIYIHIKESPELAGKLHHIVVDILNFFSTV